MTYRLSDIHSIFPMNCVEIIAFEYTDPIGFWEFIKKGDEAALVIDLDKGKVD